MKKVWKLLALAGSAYLIFVVTTLPASVVLGRFERAGLEATAVSGSIWHGSAAQLSARGLNLGRVEWRIRALSLLVGRLRVDLTAERSDGFARGTAVLRFPRHVELHNFAASLPVAAAAELGVPVGWTGRADIRLERLSIEDGWIRDARGSVEGVDLTGPARNPVNIGSYRVTLPADEAATEDKLVGHLEDTGGPLAVTGRIQFGQDRSYLIEGRIAPRPDAPRSVLNAIRYLGAPDADGTRPFALEGTL